jgi:hypothetical protein
MPHPRLISGKRNASRASAACRERSSTRGPGPGIRRPPVTVTRLVTRDGGRHRLMKNLFIRARMIEDDDERDLVITDGVIADADPVAGTETDATGWVLPGLADVHNHLSLASPAGDDQDADVRVRASASVELALGVLAIREPGSPDDASTRLAEEAGWPRVITAGRFLAPPGGYFPGLARGDRRRVAVSGRAGGAAVRWLGEDHR